MKKQITLKHCIDYRLIECDRILSLKDQPCERFWEVNSNFNCHQCPKCLGTRRFCENCHSDHHDNGWKRCDLRNFIKVTMIDLIKDFIKMTEIEECKGAEDMIEPDYQYGKGWNECLATIKEEQDKFIDNIQ